MLLLRVRFSFKNPNPGPAPASTKIVDFFRSPLQNSGSVITSALQWTLLFNPALTGHRCNKHLDAIQEVNTRTGKLLPAEKLSTGRQMKALTPPSVVKEILPDESDEIVTVQTAIIRPQNYVWFAIFHCAEVARRTVKKLCMWNASNLLNQVSESHLFHFIIYNHAVNDLIVNTRALLWFTSFMIII